jgi:hypothetical protein
MTTVEVQLFGQNERLLRWEGSGQTSAISELLSLPEDADLQVSIVCRGTPRLYLGDIEVLLEAVRTSEDGVDRWSTKRECHLRNFVGQCPVVVAVNDSDPQIAFLLEIHAKKVTADQVRAMLTELVRRDADVVRLCFSKVTSETGRRQENAGTPEVLVQLAERFIGLLMEQREYLRARFCRRVMPQAVVAARSDRDQLDDRGLSWIVHNLDQVYESEEGLRDFRLRGRNYRIARIERTKLIDDADVYENQVLLATVQAIRSQMRMCLAAARPTKAIREAVLADYVSFSDLLSGILPMAPAFVQRASALVEKAAHLARFFQDELGVSEKKEQRLRITPFVRRNPVYRRLFWSVHEWRAKGVPSWVGRDFQLQLLSVAKLYEFYCLFSLIEALIADGFAVADSAYVRHEIDMDLLGTEVPRPLAEPLNRYRLTRGKDSLVLLYEPRIFAFARTKSSRSIDELSLGPTGRYTYRQPDFVVLRHAPRGIEYFVLDAKYSSADTAAKRHLPECVTKYFINMGAVAPDLRVDYSRCMGVAVVNIGTPGGQDSSRLMGDRYRDFGHSGDRFILPTFVSITCAPNAAAGLTGFVGTLVNRWFALGDGNAVTEPLGFFGASSELDSGVN